MSDIQELADRSLQSTKVAATAIIFTTVGVVFRRCAVPLGCILIYPDSMRPLDLSFGAKVNRRCLFMQQLLDLYFMSYFLLFVGLSLPVERIDDLPVLLV